jgi:hypothetical protein
MYCDMGEAERGLGKMTCTALGLGIPPLMGSFSPAGFPGHLLPAQKVPAPAASGKEKQTKKAKSLETTTEKGSKQLLAFLLDISDF